MGKKEPGLLTEEEFETVVSVIRENYGTRFRFTENMEDYLRSRVVEGTTERIKGYQNTADIVREYLWNTFSGGGVSASVTRKAYAAIGRENECNKNWI